MSHNIVTRGLGGPLTVTEGFGRSGALQEFTEGPGGVIVNFLTNAQALFITQFRRVRDLSLEAPIIEAVAPSTVPVDNTIVASQPITDFVVRAKALFVTQFRRIP